MTHSEADLSSFPPGRSATLRAAVRPLNLFLPQPQRAEVAHAWCTTNLIQVVARIDSPRAVKMIQPRFDPLIRGSRPKPRNGCIPARSGGRVLGCQFLKNIGRLDRRAQRPRRTRALEPSLSRHQSEYIGQNCREGLRAFGRLHRRTIMNYG